MNKERINLNNEAGPEDELYLERQKQWKKAEDRVDKLMDRLGKPIDEGIKESVVSICAHEIPTTQSCEGHVHQEEKVASPPWIQIYAPEPEGWKNNKEKQREWTLENLKLQRKLIQLLDKFYKNRSTSFDIRLSFEKVGAFGGFRLQSTGANLFPVLSFEEQKQALKSYRNELNEFGLFLKDSYFAK